jgi:hypothetical protein
MTAGQSSRSSRTKELSAADHQEIEWQFDAGELESVEGWLDQHNSGSLSLIVAPESTVELTDTYYDTDDWFFTGPATPCASVTRMAQSRRR